MGSLRVRTTLLAAGALLGMAGPLHAESGALWLGVTGGTLGVGPEIGYRLSPTIGVRANATLLAISHGFDSDDIHYDGRIRLRSAGAMIDLFPFAGGFRVSGGVRTNGNRARVRATPISNVEINGTTYTPAQIGTIRGRGETRDVAPSLTIGYGGRLAPGFTAGIEAGALFQGRVRVRRFTTSNPGISPADLESERASIQDDVDDYKVYPIVQLALGWRF